TYVAAGLFSTPLSSFAIVTGCAVLVWVTAIFGVTKLLGASVLSWFAGAESRFAFFVLTVLIVVTAVALLRRLEHPATEDSGRTTSGAIKGRPSGWQLVRRITTWEFWPTWLFYLPVGFYYGWLGLRYRSLTLPSAANPVIPTGGLVGESKCAILDLLRD